MKLYIKQKVFSWKDRFRVWDENENEIYSVEGKVFSWGKKLFVYDSFGQERAYIHEKVLSFLPKYFISQNGVDVAEVKKKLTFIHPVYIVSPLGWTVKGDFLAHNYTVTDETGNVVITVSKKWLAWGDTYEINVVGGTDDLMALCVVLIIDAVLAQEAAAASAST